MALASSNRLSGQLTAVSVPVQSDNWGQLSRKNKSPGKNSFHRCLQTPCCSADRLQHSHNPWISHHKGHAPQPLQLRISPRRIDHPPLTNPLSKSCTSEKRSARKSTGVIRAGIEVPSREWEAAFDKACDDSDLPRALRLLDSIKPPQNGKPAPSKLRPWTVDVDARPASGTEQAIAEVQAYLDSQKLRTDLAGEVIVQEPDYDRDDVFDLRRESEEELRTPEEKVTVPPRVLLRVLDTCLGTSDLFLVAAAYKWLQQKGLLKAFGKVKLAGKTRGLRLKPTLVIKWWNSQFMSCGCSTPVWMPLVPYWLRQLISGGSRRGCSRRSARRI